MSEHPEDGSAGGNSRRLIVWACWISLGLVAASLVMIWEAALLPPIVAHPSARVYLVTAVVVWVLAAALYRCSRAADGRLLRLAKSMLLAVSTGGVIGAGVLAVTTLPTVRIWSYHARWKAYYAAIRVDLRDLAEAQAVSVEQRGEYGASVEELGFFSSDGVELELFGTPDGWTARTTHPGLTGFGHPNAACVVFGGQIGVKVAHRLPDGRVPLREGEPLCDLGEYVPGAREP